MLCDRSIRNALTPLRGCLRAAHAAGLLDSDLCEQLVLPRRRGGKPHEFLERRFLTRSQLASLLEEIPVAWRPFFDLLAATGLRISEAIALRAMDLDRELPAVRVRRAIVDGQAPPSSDVRAGRRADRRCRRALEFVLGNARVARPR